jgi:hypothetical protein
MAKGIKESAELIRFLGSFVSVTDTVLADNKVDILELTGYFNTILTIKSAIEGIKDIPGEFTDLDPAERTQLTAVLAESLKLRNEKAEALAEEGFDLALRLAQFVAKVGKVKR